MLLEGQTELLSQIELVLLEQDNAKKANYAQWHQTFRAAGLEMVWHARDMQITNVVIEHTAWVRRGSTRVRRTTCTEYAARRGLSAKLLKCLDAALVLK